MISPHVQLFSGGTIRTVDANEVVDAVLTVNDRIAAVGSVDDCRAAAPRPSTSTERQCSLVSSMHTPIR